IVVVGLLLRERPSELGIGPYGAVREPPAKPAGNPIAVAFGVLRTAVASRDFWLLSSSFFVCGASSSGLVGTHLIPFCFDHGIPQVTGAGLLAAIGVFNIVGTMASGWCADRYDGRVLLMIYYGLRGLSLLYLPFSNFDFFTLSIFAAFYGLDWFATVPPMMRLITDSFGKAATPVVFGWLFAAHQVGAGLIAYLAGLLRAELGSYLTPFLISGLLCLVAAVGVLWIGCTPRGLDARGLEPA
ncbi:MAG TPA: MFS transporter, partial [Stellaceae bacterium]|nr:MFS transporter [Stellaceae bacterium]